MAEFKGRHPLNVAGKYYVDCNCLDCDACRATAPGIFQRDDTRGAYYVARQPITAEEFKLAQAALEGCPLEAIGNDGDRHDWVNTPLDPSWDLSLETKTPSEKRTCCCHKKERSDSISSSSPSKPKRPWWRLW